MAKIEMSRNEIYKFYENKIDDIKDEDTADKLFHLLGQLDDLLIELEGGIDEALELQENENEPDWYERKKGYDVTVEQEHRAWGVI